MNRAEQRICMTAAGLAGVLGGLLARPDILAVCDHDSVALGRHWLRQYTRATHELMLDMRTTRARAGEDVAIVGDSDC